MSKSNQDEFKSPVQQKQNKKSENRVSSNPDEKKLTYSDSLNIIAWLNLIASFIVAFYIWSEFGTMEVGIYSRTEMNPIAVGMGVGVITQGIIVFVLFQTIKGISKDVAFIKNNQHKNVREKVIEDDNLPQI